MDLMWIKYIGEDPKHRDNLYRTGWWESGQTKQVLAWAGKKLLLHPDMFEEGSGGSGGSGSGAAYDDTAIKNRLNAAETSLANKVDKVSGKGLSANDYTTTDKNKLSGLANVKSVGTGLSLSSAGVLTATNTGGTGASYDDSELRTLIAGKVDKESGKQLSTNDYTNAEKTKLAGLSNYNDAPLAARVTALEAKTDADTKPELAAALTAGRELGGVASGTVYPAGTPLETIVRAMLAPAAAVPLPIFATVNDRFTLEEVAVDNTAGEYILTLAAMTETEPVYFDVPAAWNAEVTIWNGLTNQWVTSWVYESSATTHTVNGEEVAYTRWTNVSETENGPQRARITWTV